MIMASEKRSGIRLKVNGNGRSSPTCRNSLGWQRHSHPLDDAIAASTLTGSSGLRCQCATCVDEMSGNPRLDPDTVPQDVLAVDHLPVGNYAYQFLWSDTHYTGIYPFRFLRSICTCIQCNTARAKAEESAG